MSELLDMALQAHGGLDRWREVQSLDAKVSLTGGTSKSAANRHFFFNGKGLLQRLDYVAVGPAAHYRFDHTAFAGFIFPTLRRVVTRPPSGPLVKPDCRTDSDHQCSGRLIRFDERKENITIRKIEIERFSLTSSKPFDVVVAALKAAVGHPDMVEFVAATKGARTFPELESAVDTGLGRTGLMMFMELDHGAILRKETGLDTPKIMRFVIGNPPDGVHLSYDKMASLLAPYGNPDALNVARDLDSKIENLLRECAV